MLIYFFDMFSTAKSYKQALSMLYIFDVLGRASLVINLDKGQMPIQVSVYFGFVMDSRSMRIYFLEKKIDIFTTAKSYEQAPFVKLFVIDVLGRAGWVISMDKGQMPTQTATYLGFVINSKSMRIYLPEAKVEKILGKIKNLLTSSWVHVREAAFVVGNVQAGARALGEQAPCTATWTRRPPGSCAWRTSRWTS